MQFLPAHPQAGTHGIVARRKRFVPDVIGPRISDKDGFARPPVSGAEREASDLDALVVLLLSCPCRSGFPAAVGDGSLLGSLDLWEETADKEHFAESQRVLTDDQCLTRRAWAASGFGEAVVLRGAGAFLMGVLSTSLLHAGGEGSL